MNPKSYNYVEWKASVCSGDFLTVREAKNIAFGSVRDETIPLMRYYQAWQFLLDKGVYLEEADQLYVDKLICDGIIFED